METHAYNESYLSHAMGALATMMDCGINKCGFSPEYWAGWVLAYYQWESGKSFRFLQNNGLDIEKVIALYHPLHEADIDKFADTADAIILNHIETSASPVKKARERIGITQKELSERSDVSSVKCEFQHGFEHCFRLVHQY